MSLEISPLKRILVLVGCIESLRQLICYLSPMVLVWWFLIHLTGLMKNIWIALLTAIIIHCLGCFGFILYIAKKALVSPPRTRKFVNS